MELSFCTVILLIVMPMMLAVVMMLPVIIAILDNKRTSKPPKPPKFQHYSYVWVKKASKVTAGVVCLFLVITIFNNVTWVNCHEEDSVTRLFEGTAVENTVVMTKTAIPCNCGCGCK